MKILMYGLTSSLGGVERYVLERPTAQRVSRRCSCASYPLRTDTNLAHIGADRLLRK